MASTSVGAPEPPLLDFLQEQSKCALRRFAIGFSLNSGVWILQQLLRFDRKRRINVMKILVRMLCNRESASLGAFMACFGLVYQLTKRLASRNTTSTITPAVVAGAAAGVSIHCLSASFGTHLDPTALSLHALVRSIEAAARQTSFARYLNHADAAIFISSCTVIMYCWFFHPSALSSDYRKWISRMAQMDHTLLDLVRQLKDGRIRYGVHTRVLDDYCDRHGVQRSKGDLGNGFLTCEVLHPQDGTNCGANALRRTARGFIAALSLYIPVHVVAQVLVHRKRLFAALSASDTPVATATSPLSEWRQRAETIAQSLRRALLAAVRSSVFLGSFIGLAWAGVCLSRQLRQDDLPSGPLLASFMSGWAIMLEAPNRRAELAAYVAPRALQTAWHRLVNKGYVRSLPGAHVSVFSLATALLMAAYENSRQSTLPPAYVIPPLLVGSPTMRARGTTALASSSFETPFAAVTGRPTRSLSAPGSLQPAAITHLRSVPASTPVMLVPASVGSKLRLSHVSLVHDNVFHLPSLAQHPSPSIAQGTTAAATTTDHVRKVVPFSPTLAAIIELCTR